MKNSLIKKLKEIPEKILEFILPKSEKARKADLLKADILLDKLAKSSDLKMKDTKVLFSYKDSLIRDLIWLFKYNHNKKVINLLGEITSSILSEWLEDLESFENFTSPVLVPVPMSKTKKILRRGNHIEILCEEILKLIPDHTLFYNPKSLIKSAETKSQARTNSKKERLENVIRSFEADIKNIKGKNIVLIDDVITTGATITECKKVLLEAGAKRVIIFALAH